MGRFLKKIVLFVVIMAAWMGAMYNVNTSNIENGDPLGARADARVIFAGDSMILRGLDPSHYDSSATVAQIGEPYFATFWKLDYILPRIKNLETVVVGFGPHSFSTYHYDKISRPARSRALFERIYAVDRMKELDAEGVNWRAYWGVKIKNLCLIPHEIHDSFLSPYENSRRAGIRDTQRALRRHFTRNGKPAGNSERLVEYQDRIIALCKERGVRLVFLASPVRADYKQGVPEIFMLKYRQRKAELEKRGVKVLDLRDAAFPDYEFRDANHLNSLGAERLTQLLQQKLAP